MPIQSISRTAFEQLHSDRRPSVSWEQEQFEWFADRSRVLVGYIAKNVRSGDWSIVIEGRDERGKFHEVESRNGIASEDDARALAETTVNELLATGVKVFQRGSYALHSPLK